MNTEDISSILGKLNIDSNSISPDMVNGFLNMLGNSKKEEPADSHNNSDFSSTVSEEVDSSEQSNSASPGIDMDMLFKMKSMIDTMNVKDDPRANLLGSLKPYLKESRKDKLDQYIQLLNMSKMVDFLPFLGGGNKKDE